MVQKSGPRYDEIYKAAFKSPPGIVNVFEGGSSTGSRMAKFNAALDQAQQTADATVKFSIPKANATLKDFANCARQINQLVEKSQGTEDENVSSALDALSSAFGDADAAISPLADTVDTITQALAVYKKTQDTVNPWNTAGPGVTSLDTIRQAGQALDAQNAKATSALTKLKRVIAAAKPVIEGDASTRQAAISSAQADQLQQAQAVVKDAISQAVQSANSGNFDTALGLLNDPAIGQAAQYAGMTAQLQTTANSIAAGRDRHAADDAQNSQMTKLFQFLTALQQTRQAQYPGYSAPVSYSAPAASQPYQPTGAPTNTSTYADAGMFGLRGLGSSFDITSTIANARAALQSQLKQVQAKLAPVIGADAANVTTAPSGDWGTTLLWGLGGIVAGLVAYKTLKRRRGGRR